jgi:hypothetical protein
MLNAIDEFRAVYVRLWKHFESLILNNCGFDIKFQCHRNKYLKQIDYQNHLPLILVLD